MSVYFRVQKLNDNMVFMSKNEKVSGCTTINIKSKLDNVLSQHEKI